MISVDTVDPLDVVTFGESMALQLADPGVSLDLATTFRASIAGAESNVAIGVARLGHRAGWFGRLGTDGPGRAVLARLRGSDVDTSRVVLDSGAPTGVLIRDCHPVRPVEVVYHRAGSAGSRLAPADLDHGYLASAAVLHCTGITPLLADSAREATLAAVRTARGAGVLVSFDPNVRRKLAPLERIVRVQRELAGSADLVLAGADEAELISGAAGMIPAAAWFLDRGARLVVLKLGANGSWATDGRQEWHVDVHRVPAVDPVGAGDAYTAGFLSAWLRGLPVPEAMREAAAVAALVVAAPGDVEGLPTAAQRDAVLSESSDVDR